MSYQEYCIAVYTELATKGHVVDISWSESSCEITCDGKRYSVNVDDYRSKSVSEMVGTLEG